jgi:phenylpyruvate tautomerase
VPVLKIQTNVTVPDTDRESLISNASASVAEMLEKPERYVMIVLEDDTSMGFATSSDPACYLELKSIGLPQEKTSRLAFKLCELINRTLGVKKERIFIEFTPTQRHLFAWNGDTF